MDIVTTFNPILKPNGSFDMTVKNGGTLLVINESSANLILSFGNGSTTYVPANDRRMYTISGQMAQPHTNVTWSQQSTLPNQNITNQTVVEVYQPGEDVNETYPSPLVRNTSVAGIINATSLNVFSGPTPLQIVISIDEVISGLTSFLLTNQAFMQIGEGVGSGGTLAGKILVQNPTTNATTIIQSGNVALVSPTNTTDIALTANETLINGSVSGTIRMWQPFTGLFKMLVVEISGYQNASTNSLVLPVAFTNGGFFWVGGFGPNGIQFLKSAVAQSARVLTAIAVGGGTTTGTTTVAQASLGEILNGFDTITYPAQGGSHSAYFIVIGS